MWNGEGYYNICWSDGGMDWTSDGPVWFETKRSLYDELRTAEEYATSTHLPYAEYIGEEL